MSNIEDRADDYERRVNNAGGGHAVVEGLVIGAERTSRLLRWLVLSLIFDVLLSVFLGTVAFMAQQYATDADRAARVACVQSAENSMVINTVLDELILNTETGTFLTEKQKEDRIAGYRLLIIDIPECR